MQINQLTNYRLYQQQVCVGYTKIVNSLMALSTLKNCKSIKIKLWNDHLNYKSRV